MYSIFCTCNRKMNYSDTLQSPLLFAKNTHAHGLGRIRQLKLKPQVVSDLGLLTPNVAFFPYFN